MRKLLTLMFLLVYSVIVKNLYTYIFQVQGNNNYVTGYCNFLLTWVLILCTKDFFAILSKQ